MSIIDDCVKFLEDLIMGDFNDEQMVSAQIIGGLVSLIPVMDQVMDVRDISGTLYRINKRGGLAKATLDQKVDLGFAAFGVIPEVGSAFKTVFKPLYRQRERAKGVINGGVAMIETMLGKKKGGAVRWVRALDWAGNTQAAIIQANMALESCIAMLEYLGQKHWWCPDRIEQLARDVAPSLRSMRGKLAAPIREAAAEIRKFLEGLLGEHAAAVAMSVAGNAVAARNARPAPGARANARGQHQQLGAVPKTQQRPRRGRTANITQKMAYEIYSPLNFALKGLLGEHIVDHHVIEKKNWGLKWNEHDRIGVARGSKKAGWQSDFKKINDNETPLYLCTPSSHVLTSGIDSLWFTNRGKPHQYAVVEAKASMSQSPQLLSLLGEANDGAAAESTDRQKSQRTQRGRPTGGRRTATAASKPKKNKVLQMSHEWISKRVERDFFRISSAVDGNYSRHVMLVTPVEAGEHVLAVGKILSEGLVNNPVGAQKFAAEHASHNIAKEFGEADLDAANKTYKQTGKPAKATKPTTKRRPR